MAGIAAKRIDTPELLTLPAAHRRYGIGLRTLRREASRGSFPTYSVGTSWPRVLRTDLERWIRSTRVTATSHATARVEEVLARETAARGS